MHNRFSAKLGRWEWEAGEARHSRVVVDESDRIPCPLIGRVGKRNRLIAREKSFNDRRSQVKLRVREVIRVERR